MRGGREERKDGGGGRGEVGQKMGQQAHTEITLSSKNVEHCTERETERQRLTGDRRISMRPE